MGKELRTNRGVIFTERPPIPHNMLIELTNICNHQCVFCGYKSMKRPKRQCDKALMKDIMKQAFDLGTREVGFYLIGEPFLNPDLEEYVAYASELGFEYIYITTNGALATIERTKKLVDLGLNSIKFSINAATPETYKTIHGKDDYAAVLKNVRDLRNYVASTNANLNMFISFVKTTITDSTRLKLEDDFKDLVDKIYYYDCANQGGAMLELITDGIVREGELHNSPSPCGMVFNRFHVTCEGFLDACCSDVNGFLAAADLRETSLRDAWYSEEMISLRTRFLNNDLKGTICYNCVNGANDPVSPLNQKLIQY